jgi:hypothetical protein
MSADSALTQRGIIVRMRTALPVLRLQIHFLFAQLIAEDYIDPASRRAKELRRQVVAVMGSSRSKRNYTDQLQSKPDCQ